jgi:hypothetical protein
MFDKISNEFPALQTIRLWPILYTFYGRNYAMRIYAYFSMILTDSDVITAVKSFITLTTRQRLPEQLVCNFQKFYLCFGQMFGQILVQL